VIFVENNLCALTALPESLFAERRVARAVCVAVVGWWLGVKVFALVMG